MRVNLIVMRRTGMILAGIVFSLILISSSSIAPSYSEYITPKKQIESGVLPEDVTCRENRVLVIRDNGNPACVHEKTADKKSWIIIKRIFSIDNKIKNNEMTLQDSVINSSTAQTIETDTITTNLDNTKKYDTLNFAITSDVEFSGEAYGYYEPTVLRRPAPREISANFGADHYDIPQILQSNAVSLSAGDTTPQILLANTITSNSEHDNAINYRQYMPTIIPDGFELKWIDISQPGVYGDDVGRMKIHYYPNNVEISGDMLDYEAADIASFVVGIRTYPYKEIPVSQERIDRVTKDGTSTHVFFEEKYGGIYETIVESPSDPNVKGVTLFTNNYELWVLGTGLPLETYEKIFLDIFERQ